jgi:hypothetical protein
MSSLQSDIDPKSTTTPSSKRSKQKKNDDKILPTATSRKNDRLPKMKMKKGSRVKTQRMLLYHLCIVFQRMKFPCDAANTYNVYDNVMNGKSSKGWEINFDMFHPEDKIIHVVVCNRFLLVAEGAEEKHYDRDVDMEEVEIDAQFVEEHIW